MKGGYNDTLYFWIHPQMPEEKKILCVYLHTMNVFRIFVVPKRKKQSFNNRLKRLYIFNKFNRG